MLRIVSAMPFHHGLDLELAKRRGTFAIGFTGHKFYRAHDSQDVLTVDFNDCSSARRCIKVEDKGAVPFFLGFFFPKVRGAKPLRDSAISDMSQAV